MLAVGSLPVGSLDEDPPAANAPAAHIVKRNRDDGGDYEQRAQVELPCVVHRIHLLSVHGIRPNQRAERPAPSSRKTAPPAANAAVSSRCSSSHETCEPISSYTA